MAQHLTNIGSCWLPIYIETAWHRTLLLTAKPSICLFHKCADTVCWKTRRRQWHQRKGSIYLLYKWENTAFWQCYGRKSQVQSSKCLVYQGPDNALWLCTGRTDVKRKFPADVCSESQPKNFENVYFTILCPFFMSDGRNERVNLPHDRALQ